MSKKLKLFYWASLVIGVLISFSVMAKPAAGLVADTNFQALKNDPAVLFSKTNTCRLESLLGKKDFAGLKETMPLMTDEKDEPNYVSISGNVRGLFTIMEGFFRLSKSGQIWIAYLEDGQVHYFTNDAASLKQPPKIMQDWASRFKEAKWIEKLVTIERDTCK